MSDETSEVGLLARLTREYRAAIDDVMALQIDEVTRIARLLEVEARFQGMFEACKESLGSGGSPGARTH